MRSKTRHLNVIHIISNIISYNLISSIKSFFKDTEWQAVVNSLKQGKIKKLRIEGFRYLFNIHIWLLWSFFRLCHHHWKGEIVFQLSFTMWNWSWGVEFEYERISSHHNKLNIGFHHQIETCKLGDEGCANLFEGLKKNKSLKVLNLGGVYSNNNSLMTWDHFQIVESWKKELNRFLVFFLKMELFLRNWI